ncbi:regulator [Rhodosalinus sediminis]|uniref:Regulator n=1 Tax=Rhodosalinus sediminis TaxID=1940533 RepID=A0A3D9BZ39_9RHOB|nr:regulator [Rhodosalinus sediminis]
MIDQNLRKVYDDLVEDEIPDRFRSLLDQLRRQEGGK